MTVFEDFNEQRMTIAEALLWYGDAAIEGGPTRDREAHLELKHYPGDPTGVRVAVPRPID